MKRAIDFSKHIYPSFLLWLILAFVMFSGFSYATHEKRSYHLNVKKITKADGISNIMVNDMIQAQSGLLWFATPNGLNRYNGYKFDKFYESDEGLSSSDIHDIYQDNEGNLWIATANGIDIFDPLADSVIQTYSHRPGEPSSLLSNDVSKIFQSSDSTLWICYDKAVIDIYTGEDEFQSINNPYKQQDDNVGNMNSITEDQKGNIWVGYLGQGLYRISNKGEEIERYMQGYVNIGDIWVDSANTVWVTAVEKGLFYKPENADTFQRQVLPDSLREKGYSLDEVSHFYPQSQTKFWLTNNLNQRFLLYDHKNGTIEDYTSSLGPFSHSDLWGIISDKSDNLWITSEDGVFKLAISKTSFHQYLAQPYPLKDYKNRISTRGMLETEKGDILIASYNGTYKLNTQTGDIKKYNKFKNAMPRDFEPVPYDLYQDSVGDFWIASEGSGLLHYDKSKESIRAIFSKEKLDIFDDFYLYAIRIMRDTKGRFWIGTYDGLYFYRKGDSELTKYRIPQPNKDFSTDKIWCIEEDNDHMLWVGTNDGLYYLHPDTGLVQHYFQDEKNNVLANNSIISMHRDSNNIFWLGTKEGGLIRFDPSQNSSDVFIKNQSRVLSNVIYSILEKNDSTLWLGTDYGLIQFDKKGKQLKTFLPDDGLSHHEFNHGSALKTSDGHMYFGGMNGVNMVPNKEFKRQPKNRPVILTQLDQFVGDRGKLVDKTAYARQRGRIVLEPTDKFVKLNFTLTNYQNPTENRYRYKLADHDQEWHYLGKENHLRLNNLPYGNYMLKIQGANSHGKWSKNMLTLQITVLTPYYLKWWFIVVVVLTGLLLIAFVVYVWSVRLQKAKLEKLVNQKTQELQSRLRELENSNKELEQYAYIVSHDLKGPLRTIASYTQMLEKKYKNQLDQHADMLMQYIVGGVHRMHNIIQDLLIYSQVGEEGTKFVDVDMNEVLEETKTNLQREVKDNNVEIRAQQLPTINANRSQMLQVFLNLVSNAIKYGKKDEQTIIKVSAEDEGDQWLFKVEDNSEGMDMTYHSKAFEPFQRLYNSDRPGTGMGLAICNKVVKLHNGAIWFNSKQGEGTIFYFSIAKNLQNNKG